MTPYKNIGHDSGVAAFELGPDWIHVKFTTGAVYEYTTTSAGAANIDRMKRLAEAGDGLNAFINTHVKQKYSRRIR